MPELGVKATEVRPTPTIEGVRTGISAAFVETKRGIPWEPRLLNGESSLFEEFGYYVESKYSHYMLRGAFKNGSNYIWGIRAVGEDAKSAAGADGQKIATTKAQLSFGMVAHPVVFEAATRGLAGTEVSIEAVANSVDKSELVVSGKEIQLKLANASAWQKTGNVIHRLLDGHSILVDGASLPTSIIYYATTAGPAGVAYEVEVVDTGGAGPATYTYSPDGYTLTIDLVGTTPTVATAVAAINALGGGISAAPSGDGSGNLAVMALANLEGGSAAVVALGDATCDGSSTDAITAFARTFLAGTGAVTAAGNTLTTNVTGASSTPITSKVVYGDKVVILNGPDKGAYEVIGVTETGVSVTNLNDIAWTGWSASQTNLLYTVYGTESSYDHITMRTPSVGEGGDSIYGEITKNRVNNELTFRVKCLDEDSTVRTLEEFSGLSADPSSAKYIETIVNADSRWSDLDIKKYLEISSISGGSTTINDNTLTKAGATMETDGCEVGTLCMVTSSTTAADMGLYVVTEVTSETQIKVDRNFSATVVGAVDFVLLNEDTTGNELLSYIGSSTITLTMAGGVDDTPDKSDYEGNASNRTGVYALKKVNPNLWPNKFMVCESVSVLDSSGADATSDLDKAMAEYCGSNSGAKDTMIYGRYLEFGQDPNDVLTTVATENFTDDFLATWWNWGKVSDPISGTTIWCPLTGHMFGVIDGMDSGQLGEGLHQAPANVVLKDVLELEYDADVDDASTTSEVYVNAIINEGGIRPYGDYLQATTPDFQFLHKRLITIRTMRSVVESLARWLPWAVQAKNTRKRVVLAIDTYCEQYDRRTYPVGCFENYEDATLKPWSVLCNETNNDNGTTVVNIEHGFDIVNTIERVNYRYGFNMSSGALTVEQV